LSFVTDAISLFAQSTIALLRDRRFGAIAFPPHSIRLDDPYLPLLVQGTAGLPLDPSFAEQNKILRR
jgi:hypothetical protein